MPTKLNLDGVCRKAGSILLLISLVFFSACSPEETPENPYAFEEPADFPPVEYTFENNPITAEGVELGRAIFYDPILSADSTIACANCHQQVRAFSDPVHRFSFGVQDRMGNRNSPAIQNLAFEHHFFWDGGVKHLDFVPINAITNPVELDESLAHLVEKLQRSEFYQQKFNRAFGSPEVDSQKMLYALSQFMNLMISDNSRYDQWKAREATLTSDEIEGLELFKSRCATCHATELFTDQTFRNNGLDADFSKDPGRMRITETEVDAGKFKVPSLRNVGITAPYMHDGRFTTLEQVLEHYRSGVKNSPTLDAQLIHDGSYGISMTEAEKQKIISFLHTLTDHDFITDKRFSNPFLK